MGGFAQIETSRDGKPDLCYHGKGFFNTSFRTSVWWAIMQSLAQYLARKTLGGVMLLTYLLGLPSWQPVTPSDIGVRLPGWEGGWEARAAARCYMVHWLLQLLLLCLQRWPASGCACIKRAGWKCCTPQYWCVFTWVWEVLGLQYLGVGESINFYLRSSFLSPLGKPQAELQRVWWGSLRTLNVTSGHFYISKKVAAWRALISGLSEGELKRSALSGSSWSSLSSANQMPFKPAFFCVEKW